MKTQMPTFRTRARIINQLGEQLIRNESIALLELIKNSYDADAGKCKVLMTDPESKSKGQIVIEDNGEGMNYDILSSSWLELGTSYKNDLLKNESTQRSRKFKRIRLGEKGIGRLGAHRLGKYIKIITRQRNSKEYVLKINWDDISNSHYIEDLPIEIQERSPKVFKTHSGTKIIIGKFRVPWTRQMARHCARSILSLNSPFDEEERFRVSFEIESSNWLDGLLTFSDIEHYKLFSFDITMSGNEIRKFTYEFIPWATMKKLKHRKVTLKNPEVKNLTRMLYKTGLKYTDIELDKYMIGKVRFRGIIFDRDSRILDLGVQDKLGLRKYLNQNGGIRVFRDNMRVLDYGEQGNDWLDLGGRRVNFPTKRVSNNIILGSVFLDRSKSTDLAEKANREGFVENKAYWELWKTIRFAIDRVESLRKTDKDLLRKFYGPKKSSEPLITAIIELKESVNKNVKDDRAKKEMIRYLDRIEEEYTSITEILLKSAGAGLNLIAVIHQIEKIIKDLQQMLKKGASADVLTGRVVTLSNIVEGYSILIKKSEIEVRNLKGIIDQCVFNEGFRLEAHKIKIESAYLNRRKILGALCSVEHTLNALMNLFDNSIWWLGYYKIKNPSIFIDISNEYPGYTSIVFADNGLGFTLPTKEIIKPFVSNKDGGSGIGLHITDRIMDSLGGLLLFPEMDVFDIPSKYKDGAKLALAFKKK